MIARLTGRIIEKYDYAVLLEASGVCYEVLVPVPVLQRLESQVDNEGKISLVTYHYFQMSQSSGVPVLVGFLNTVERDFFLQIITVSGVGPRAAVKALNKSFADIARAINESDIAFLKSLPGIGPQKAKEIVAKLQGKVGRFGLIRDQGPVQIPVAKISSDWAKEALEVLLQLQYKRPEAQGMIEQALKRTAHISSAEELLNEIYQQRINN